MFILLVTNTFVHLPRVPQGVQVATATSGRAAQLALPVLEPDIIIVDADLGDISWRQLLSLFGAEARAARAQIAVVGAVRDATPTTASLVRRRGPFAQDAASLIWNWLRPGASPST